MVSFINQTFIHYIYTCVHTYKKMHIYIYIFTFLKLHFYIHTGIMYRSTLPTVEAINKLLLHYSSHGK